MWTFEIQQEAPFFVCFECRPTRSISRVVTGTAIVDLVLGLGPFQEHVVVVDYTIYRASHVLWIALREGGSTVKLVEGELGSEGMSAKMFWRQLRNLE